jgi:starch synthase
LKILMAASEAIPYAKTGGLADIVGSLPEALRRLGHEVAVVLPRYASIPLDGLRRIYDHLPIYLGLARYEVSIYAAPEKGQFYFVDCPPLFGRAGLYGDAEGDYPDNHIRFAVFCRATLEIVRRIYRPHVLHCHDWQAALIPVYTKTLFSGDPAFIGIPTLLTVHNLGYQGIFPAASLPEIGLDGSVFHSGALEFHGKVNLLKGGLVFGDALTTVSPKYAQEILTPEYGFGLDGVLLGRRDALTGILNGADYSHWDPKTDPQIPANYSAADLSGKQKCKRELLREFGFPESAMKRPLIGMVSRLAAQKGADLVAEAGPELAKETLSFVAVGQGDAALEKLFHGLAKKHPDKIAVKIEFNEALAHRVEAGSDMFLMPSRYEPCGLNQIYSLRYGTVPVVRATGGLDDTIEQETGFKFSECSGAALVEAVRTACRAYRDPDRWRSLMLRGMARDFSWEAAARQYSEIYGRLVESRTI